MNRDTSCDLDVMQVCRNGHVITDRLRTLPERGRSHCDRCGAPTLDHCLTCGWELPGAMEVPGLVPIGSWPAPRYCLMCGAPFPWVRQPLSAADPLAVLESLLRRVPLAIRQLGWRHGDRPALRVEDDRDLEDVVRALLPLQFDDVRLENRTPSYSPGTRTDLVLAPAKIAITVKNTRSNMTEPKLLAQWNEDIAYYRQKVSCRVLVGFIYDPEGVLRDWQILESIRSESEEDLDMRWIVGARN